MDENVDDDFSVCIQELCTPSTIVYIQLCFQENNLYEAAKMQLHDCS